jgi:multiple sugar transport system ATP-binding protein
MVFQNYALYPHMNVYNNMAFGLQLRKVPPDQIEKKVQEAADILSIRELLTRKPKELSGGQLQRVALGRAIVREPAVFLMDEPLSNLDAKLRVQMRAEIAKLHKRLGATTIYVTHDQVEAMTMADRIVVMKDGIVQQIATPQTLYDQPVNRFVAGFIGTPPMNFLHCRVAQRPEGGLQLVGDSIAVTAPATWVDRLLPFVGQEVVLGSRPENTLPGQTGTDEIQALVEVVEPLGSETFLHLKVGGQSFIIRVSPDYRPAIGEIVMLTFAMDKAHVFATGDGKTIV